MKKFVSSLRSKALILSTAGLSVASLFSVAYADEFETKAGSVVGKIIDVMCKVVRWAGVPILAWGVISFVMGMRDEDVEKKHKASMLAIVGIVMILIGWLVQPVMNQLGMGINMESGS